jgi:hypothetical protein
VGPGGRGGAPVGTVDELAHDGLGVATEAEHWRADGHGAAPRRGVEEDGRRPGVEEEAHWWLQGPEEEAHWWLRGPEKEE